MGNVSFDRFDFHGIFSVLPCMESIDSMSPIRNALQKMLQKDYSQMPVLENGTCIGVVTLSSILKRIKTKDKDQSFESFRDYLNGPFAAFPVKGIIDEDFPTFVKIDANIMDYVDIIAKTGYVIIGNPKNPEKLLTSSDLVRFFQRKTEAFLLLREIETMLRYLVQGRFTDQELEVALNSVDTEENKKVQSIDELSFNDLRQFIRSNWSKLEEVFINKEETDAQLDSICRLRNKIFHFKGRIYASNLHLLKVLRDNYSKLVKEYQ